MINAHRAAKSKKSVQMQTHNEPTRYWHPQPISPRTCFTIAFSSRLNATTQHTQRKKVRIATGLNLLILPVCFWIEVKRFFLLRTVNILSDTATSLHLPHFFPFVSAFFSIYLSVLLFLGAFFASSSTLFNNTITALTLFEKICKLQTTTSKKSSCNSN